MFIILAGAEAGLSRSSTSRAGSWVSLSFSIRGRGRSLAQREGRTSTTQGWSTAGVASFSALGSPAWLPVPPPAARAVVASRAREDRPGRRALLGRHSCSGAVLPLHRYGASARRSVPRSSGRIRVGICRWANDSCRRCQGGCGSRSPRRRRDHRHHPCSGPPALCTCPRPSCVGAGEGKVAVASALRPSSLQFGHPERGSSSLLLERATASHPSAFCCSAGPPIVWGCSYLRRWNQGSICNGTLNAGFIVHCGCRGLNTCVFSAQSRVFSSFRALRLVCRLTEPLHQA
jgi:hypothetical protein